MAAPGVPAAGVRLLPAPVRRGDAGAPAGPQGGGRTQGRKQLAGICSSASTCASRRNGASRTTRAACASGSASRRPSPAIPRLIIVDEPTAGLDPEERIRFYHLLSELAADRIVLLSTHIVEDVAVLCPRFAVIREGRLLAVTTPGEARAAIARPHLRGHWWRRRPAAAARGAHRDPGDAGGGAEPGAHLRAVRRCRRPASRACR